MKVETPQIIWHSKDSKFADRVYSLDFQPGTSRLATAGADEFIHIWEITREAEWKLKILSRLLGHEKEVNCIRFSASGELLASGGQDDSLCIWKPTSEKQQVTFGHNSEDVLGFPEYWKRITIMKCMAPVISLSWSPDDYKVVVGTEDDRVTIWNVITGKLLRQLDAHTHIVMGVSWDPKDQFIASQSSDQTVRIWKSKIKKIKKNSKLNSNGIDVKLNQKDDIQTNINNVKLSIENNRTIPESSSVDIGISNHISQKISNSDIKSWKLHQTIKYETVENSKSKQSNAEIANNSDVVIGDCATLNNNKLSSNNNKRKCLFLAESATTTFFRRLDWSPNGEMLVVPTGQYLFNQENDGNNNQVLIPVSYIFLRNEYSYPAAVLPSPDGTTSSIRFNPVTFSSIKTSKNQNPLSNNKITPKIEESWIFPKCQNNQDIPRYIFSVTTLAGTIYIYDTQHLHPIVSIRGLHFQGMNDASWSSDGHTLAVASSDGYITIIFFENGELGDVLIPAHIPNTHYSDDITPAEAKSNEYSNYVENENCGINQNHQQDNFSLTFKEKPVESTNHENLPPKAKRKIVPTILVSYGS